MYPIPARFTHTSTASTPHAQADAAEVTPPVFSTLTTNAAHAARQMQQGQGILDALTRDGRAAQRERRESAGSLPCFRRELVHGLLRAHTEIREVPCNAKPVLMPVVGASAAEPAMCAHEVMVPPRWDGNAFAEIRTVVEPCPPKKKWKCEIL